jgi:hypothetical protein
MRVIVLMILIVVLSTEQLIAAQSTSDPVAKQEIATLPSNSLVEVTVRGGGTLRGHIVRRTETDFSLQRERRGGTQNIAYDQVLSVSQVKGGHSHKKWIIIGVVVGAVAVVAIIFVAVVEHAGPGRIGF